MGTLLWFFLGSFDATVRLWDSKSQSTKAIQVLEESGDSVSSLHVIGHEIITGSVDGKMRLYDLRMGMLHVDVIGRKYRDGNSPPPPQCGFFKYRIDQSSDHAFFLFLILHDF